LPAAESFESFTDQEVWGMLTEGAAKAEVQRISEAYDRRRSIPPTRYSPFNPSNILLQQELEGRLLKVIGRRTQNDLTQKRILEIGCGTGRWLRQFIQWGANPENLAGIDLLPDRIGQARRLCPSGVDLRCRDASQLSFNNDSFDIVFQSMAFTAIFDAEMKASIANEMMRVVRQQGFILWYDFFVNNPSNPDVKGIGKSELYQLFPGCRIDCARVTLLPPLGRVLGRFSAVTYRLVSSLRFTCTHYLAVIEKNETQH
jgi:ubiquinone/menaquinone biosynthesis C-methylase UbiE